MLTTRLHLVLRLRLSGAKAFLPMRLRSGDRGNFNLTIEARKSLLLRLKAGRFRVRILVGAGSTLLKLVQRVRDSPSFLLNWYRVKAVRARS